MRLLFLCLLLLLPLGVASAAEPGTCSPAPLKWGSPAKPAFQPADEQLTVLSLNMAGELDLRTVLTGLEALRAESRPDILLLQEVEQSTEKAVSIAEELAADKGYYFVFAPSNIWEDGRLHGLAILSRYPLESPSVISLQRFDLKLKNRCRIALAATVRGPFGPLRVFNVHLDSRITISERLRQVEPVLRAARLQPGMGIIGGDFNTNDFYWLGRVVPLPAVRQEPDLRRRLEVSGFLSPFPPERATFDYLDLNLDSIYFRSLEVSGWGIDPIDFSDHRGLWATVRPSSQALPDEFTEKQAPPR
jgi:endonuclease/exonuclease/phosphatase family metal-dependent hydrolase